MTFDRRVQLFVVLAGTFVTCLLVGDIIGGKLLELRAFDKAFVISVGMVPFPLTFVLTDLLNEFYGKRAARFVTWIGFAMAVIAFTLLEIAIHLPWAPFTHESGWNGVNQPSFDNVFAGSKRILFASMIAYLLAQFVDIAVFHLLKRLTRNRALWLRATGSTAISQLLDTVVIQVIAWWGLLEAGRILELVLNSYAVKIVVAILLTPVIYAGHALLQRSLKIEPVQVDEQGNVIHPEAGPVEPAR